MVYDILYLSRISRFGMLLAESVVFQIVRIIVAVLILHGRAIAHRCGFEVLAWMRRPADHFLAGCEMSLLDLCVCVCVDAPAWGTAGGAQRIVVACLADLWSRTKSRIAV